MEGRTVGSNHMSMSDTPREHGASTTPTASRPSLAHRLRAKIHGRNAVWIAAATLVVLGGSIACIVNAQGMAQSSTDKARLAFRLNSAEVAATLKLAIQHEEDLVINASAFITGNPHASPVQFDRWAESVRAMQRYPELHDIGFIELVPARALPAFERKMAQSPLRPIGARAPIPVQSHELIPYGTRPYYCLAVDALVNNAASLMPGNIDYCAFAPSLAASHYSGQASYAPFVLGNTTTLGVETPVYRGGGVPASRQAREREFMGWLGELLVPGAVLNQALNGHPGLAVQFAYSSGTSHVEFSSGTAPAHAEQTTIDLHNGWWVLSYGPPMAAGVFGNQQALLLLAAGVLVSIMFGLLVLTLGTGRTRAMTLVREKTRELSHLALHDTLTGLPNRALVLDRADRMLARAERDQSIIAGALFVDIDGFKHVNDSHGHAAGDQLLKVVGERLQSSVRDQDTVGRLGGDEFVVLVESTAGESTLDLLADRLTDVLRDPIELDDGRKIFSVTASIGVAAGQHATPDDLLRDADLALYAAKAAGKDRYTLFDEKLHAGGDLLELEADLSAAVQADQLFLVYQPIFALPGQEVVSVEALIRWQHPTRGIVPPDSFIPLAEENGLIVTIGRWVLDEACRQASVWAEEGLQLGISVNVSAHQLRREGFADDVRSALSESGIEPSSLTLEVTETTLMRDVDAACEHLDAIKALGVQVAIDDFGTGYASLSHLRRMPVDILKIDRSFVAALNDGGHSRELLEAIFGVGQALSLTVVAEGVEDDSQLVVLEEMGCDRAQGFLLGMPSPPEVVEGMLGPHAARRAVGSPAA
jgi:diguanylate cyclase (GGDEF)-like protein